MKCSSIARANERERRFASELESATSKCERLRIDLTQLDDWQRELETQRNAAETLEVKLRLTRDQLAIASEAAEQARQAAAHVSETQEAHDRYLAASERLSELEQRRLARDRIRNEAALLEKRQIELKSQWVRYTSLVDQAAVHENQVPILEGLIREQEELESRIATLREARGAREADRREIERIDRELDAIGKQVDEATSELAECEAQRVIALSLPDLQREHLALSTALSTGEALKQSIEIREEQGRTLVRDAERLMEEQKYRRRTISELDSMRESAGVLELRRHELSEKTAHLARLRAEIERDVAMITSLESGGICPLLSERCLNLTPGESLDGRFRENVARRTLEVSDLEQVVTRLSSEVHFAQEATSRIRGLPSLLSEFDRVRALIEACFAQAEVIEQETREKLAALDEQIGLATSRLPSIEAEISRAQRARELAQQSEPLRRTIEKLKERGNQLTNERLERAMRLAQGMDSDQTLTTDESALRELGDPRSRLREIERQLVQSAEWKATLEQTSLDLAEVEAKIARARASLAQYDALETELQATRSERTSHEVGYRTFIANQQTASTLKRREDEVMRLEAECRQTENTLAGIKTSLAAITETYEPARHLKLKEEFEEVTRRVIQLSTQLELTRVEKNQLEKNLDRLQKVRVVMNIDQAEHDRLKKLHETTEFIRNTLLQAAPFITEAYLFSIAHEANQLYREISGRQDVSLSWTRDYEITLEEEGQKRPFSSLSGGEQMAAALAFRLALLKELSTISIAFFDEPTANLDEDRRRNLAQQIGRIRHFKQLFVVSHDDSFEAYTDQVIMLSEKQSIEASSGAS